MTVLRPSENRVLIRPDKVQEKKGSLFIPSSAAYAPNTGILEAIGDAGQLVFAGKLLEVGDRVLFGKYSGVEVEFDNELFLLMSKDDILAIIEDE